MSRNSASLRPTRQLQSDAHLFAALGDPVRLALVKKLTADSPQSITELSEGAPISRQAVTKHLRMLERTGVVRSVRRGRENLYAFTPGRLKDIQQFLERISAQWDQALARLKAYVEK